MPTRRPVPTRRPMSCSTSREKPVQCDQRLEVPHQPGCLVVTVGDHVLLPEPQVPHL